MAGECLRSWKRMRRRPALRRSVVKVRVRLVGSIDPPCAVVNTCPFGLPRGAYCLALALLLVVVALQGLDAAGGESDAAFRGPGLGGQRGEPACAGALKSAADGGGARAEIEVFPAQAEEFALAESRVEGEFE